MMDVPYQMQIKLALINARIALTNNNRMEARNWATFVIKRAPQTEDAWLILGAVSSPLASVFYIQKALEIDPNSTRAQKGLQWARQRLQAQNKNSDNAYNVRSIVDTQPVRTVSSGPGINIPISQ